MENNNEQAKGMHIYYSPFKQEDKFYFGGFFNLANNNIQEVFAELSGRLNKEKTYKPNEFLTSVFKETISLVDYERYVAMIADYFPMAQYLDKKHTEKGEDNARAERIKYFRDTFIALLKTVESLRNYYTHYHHEPITIDENVFEFLDNALLQTALTAKKKYVKTDKTKELLSETQKEQLDKLHLLKIEDLRETQRKVEEKRKEQKKNGEKVRKPFNFSDKKEDVINAIYNDAFRDYIVAKKGEYELYSKSQSKYTDNSYPKKDGNLDIPISQKGLVFLLSLFLSRKEIEDCKSNIKGFKGKVINKEEIDLKENSIRFMATHRIFSLLAYKGLKRKLRTSGINTDNDTETLSVYQKETLMMQMLDELSKVPDVVYQNLSKELQDSFTEDWNEYYKDNENGDYSPDEAKVIHPVIRKRYEDKFNYFAIRFLDEFANFPTLRFQVHLGNYLHHSMDKERNGIITDREIKEKITVFARLSELENKKAAFLKSRTEKEEELNDEKGYWEEFPNPSYDFPKENISVNDKEFPMEDYLARGKQSLSGKIGIKVNFDLPKDLMEDELNIFLKKIDFSVKLRDEKLEEVKVLKQKLENIKKESEKRKENKKNRFQIIREIVAINPSNEKNPILSVGQSAAYVSMNDIHSLLYEFLINKKTGKDLEEKIVKQIKLQLLGIQYKKLKKDLEQEKNILEKLLKEQEIRDNQFQTYLAYQEDLAKIKNERNKYIKSKYKEKLKKYEGKIKRKYPLFTSEKGKVAVWLANDIKRFMPKDFKKDWKGYQHRELQKSLAYYEENRENIKFLLKENEQFSRYPFNIKECFKKETLNDFYSNYLKERLKQMNKFISDLENPKWETFEEGIKECFKFLKKQNYIIKQKESILAHPVFLERGFLSDKPTMIENTPFNEENEKKFADWFKYYKKYTDYQTFYNTEKYPFEELDKKEDRKRQTQIKKQQKNDVFLLLMAKHIFKQVFEKDSIDNFELKDLFQSREERLENAAHSAKTQERNKNYIWNKIINLTIQIKYDNNVTRSINVENVKLKNIGNFRKYEIDERVKTFLRYEDGVDWKGLLDKKTKEEDIYIYTVQYQIDKYEKTRREELLKEVQELEKYIYEKLNENNKEDLKQNRNEKFKLYVLNGLLKHIKGEDISTFEVFNVDKNPEKVPIKELAEKGTDVEQKAFVLTYIRNKFAHNQLPKVEFWHYCNDRYPEIEKKKSYAEYYLEVFKAVKNKMTKR